MDAKIPVTLAVSGIHRAVSHEWTLQHMDHRKFRFSFVLLNSVDSDMERFLRATDVPYLLAGFYSKAALPGAVWAIYRFLKKQRTRVMHTHLFEANIAGLLAARLAGVPKRIYTRHHSTIHHVFFPAAVRYDRWVNRLATDIVAVSPVVEDVLVRKEGVPPEKVHLIPHGFRFDDFLNPDPGRVAAMKKKYGLEGAWPVVGVISRYTGWKGVQHIIPAFRSLLARYPRAVLVLANAQGDYADEIKRLLAAIDPSRYVEIPFEPDFVSLYRLFTVFVHVPVDNHSEAFGQIYVEALVSGIPSVFTLSGIAPAFVRHGENAWVVDYGDPAAILGGLEALLQDEALRQRLAERGRSDVLGLFPLEKMLARFEELYQYPPTP